MTTLQRVSIVNSPAHAQAEWQHLLVALTLVASGGGRAAAREPRDGVVTIVFFS